MRDFFTDLLKLQWLSAILALIGLGDSVYLLWTKLSITTIVCGLGDCEAVQASPYSSLLGIPVAALGAGGYGALLALAVWAIFAKDNAPGWLTDVRLIFAGIGLFFAAYLTGIELFVIYQICGWCVLQAVAITGIFLGLLIERKVERQAE